MKKNNKGIWILLIIVAIAFMNNSGTQTGEVMSKDGKWLKYSIKPWNDEYKKLTIGLPDELETGETVTLGWGVEIQPYSSGTPNEMRVNLRDGNGNLYDWWDVPVTVDSECQYGCTYLIQTTFTAPSVADTYMVHLILRDKDDSYTIFFSESKYIAVGGSAPPEGTCTHPYTGAIYEITEQACFKDSGDPRSTQHTCISNNVWSDDSITCYTGACLDAGYSCCASPKSCLDKKSNTGCATGSQCCASTDDCVTCTPDCTGKECGPDGCGGSCGGCSVQGEVCNNEGQCVGSSTPECGNNIIETGEECDCGDGFSICTAIQLDNEDCISLGYDSGTLSCSPTTCQFDKSGCVGDDPKPDPTDACSSDSDCDSTQCEECTRGHCVSKCLPMIQTCEDGKCEIGMFVWIAGIFFGGIMLLKVLSKN